MNKLQQVSFATFEESHERLEKKQQLWGNLATINLSLLILESFVTFLQSNVPETVRTEHLLLSSDLASYLSPYELPHPFSNQVMCISVTLILKFTEGEKSQQKDSS